MHETDHEAARPPNRWVAQAGLLLVTLGLFVWFVLAPNVWILAIPVLVALPWLWRWQQLPLAGLLALEVALVLVILLIQATCAFDACDKMADYRHPWHFLRDMAGTVGTIGPAVVLLAGLPGLVTWVARSRTAAMVPEKWRGLVQHGVPIAAATLALVPVFFVASVFGALGLLSIPGALVILPLAIGIPLSLSALVGYVVRTWVPIPLAFVAVSAKNAGIVQACADALECHFSFQMDPLVYPWIHVVIGAVLTGAAVWGMTRRAVREDGTATQAPAE